MARAFLLYFDCGALPETDCLCVWQIGPSLTESPFQKLRFSAAFKAFQNNDDNTVLQPLGFDNLDVMLKCLPRRAREEATEYLKDAVEAVRALFLVNLVIHVLLLKAAPRVVEVRGSSSTSLEVHSRLLACECPCA